VDRATFGKRALEQIKKGRPDAVSVLDDEKFQILTTAPDGNTSLTSLANYYDEYMHAEPERRSGLLDRIARIARLVDGKESLDEVRVLLVPRIRPRRYFEIDAVEMVKDLSTHTDPPPKKLASYTPLAEHLGVSLAIDRPEHIEYVRDGSRFGVPPAELDAIALANMKRMTKDGLVEAHEGLWLGHWEDDYAGERMLMPELFTKLAVKGDPVAFLPGAEVLYVTGSEDAKGLALALALVDQRVEQPRGLLRFAFVLRDGVWRLFEPGGELGKELSARLCLHLADAYGIQRKMLEAEYGDREDAPFVAGVIGVADAEGNLELTITTWTDGVHAYLARAQVIGIGRIGGEIGMIPWEDVMELAGDLLVPVPDLYPPRWEVKQFPDEATLRALMARKLEKGDRGGRGSGSASTRAMASGSASGSTSSRLPLTLAAVVVVVIAILYAAMR
jgi:hypothetical protein